MTTAVVGAEGEIGAFEAVFLNVLPRMVTQARESSAPARGFMAFGLLMYIAKLRAEGVTVTRAELARRLDKSQQMFTPHIDNLVELGLLTSRRVPGGHGVGTQWHLDLADARLVEALRVMGRAAGDGSAVSEATGDASGMSAPVSVPDGEGSAPRAPSRRPRSRSAPRSPA